MDSRSESLTAIVLQQRLIAPIPVAPRFLIFDLPVIITASVLLTALLMRAWMGRLAGFALQVCYAAYVWTAQV